MNLEGFFNLYTPNNQFYNSVLMDWLKQLRKA